MGPVLSRKHFIFCDQSQCHTRVTGAVLHFRQLNGQPVAMMQTIKSPNQCWCLIIGDSGDGRTTQLAECNLGERSETSNFAPRMIKMIGPETVTTHLQVTEDSPEPGRMRHLQDLCFFNWTLGLYKNDCEPHCCVQFLHYNIHIHCDYQAHPVLSRWRKMCCHIHCKANSTFFGKQAAIESQQKHLMNSLFMVWFKP